MSGSPSPQPGFGDPVRAASVETEIEDITSVLSPGLSAVLDLSPDGSNNARHSGQIIGWRENSYIAWECRMNPKNPWRIVHDGESILRFLSQGRACAIHTVVTDWHARGNHRIVYMSWPSQVRSQAVRREHRVEFETECKVTLESGESKEATLLQLSMRGCRIHIDGATAADKPVAVSFRLPNGFPIDKLRCQTRHTFVEDGAVVFGCQAEVAELPPASQRAIKYFVEVSIALHQPQCKPHLNVLLLGQCGEDRSELAEWLAGIGYELIETASVVELFAWLESVGAGLILLEASIQDPSAAEVARILQQTEGFNDIGLLMYGGDANSAKASAKEVGATYANTLQANDQVLCDAIKLAEEKGVPDA